MLRISVFCLFIFMFSCSFTQVSPLGKCTERRSVVEMGTSRIKLTVADVDSCKSKFLKTVARKVWKIEQDRDLHQAADGSRSLSQSAKNETIMAFEEAEKIIDETPHAQTPQVVASGIFREVTGLDTYFDKLQKIIGARPVVLTSTEEARLGLRSLQATEANLPDQFLVWDIGGNSMQLTFKNKDKTEFVHGNGSQYYKELAKTKLNHSDSPNPVGNKNVQMLKQEFLKTTQDKILPLKGLLNAVPVYGIGAVHFESILNKLQDLNDKVMDVFSIKDLRELTKHTAKLTDDQIGGFYPANQVSNQILVESIMDYLKISQVNVRALDLTQGALVFGIQK